MVSDPYVGLHVHTHGSFLDGRSTVDMVVGRAVELGQQAVAITDHGECNQHIAHERACKKAGIKPIYGMEGYLVHKLEDYETDAKGKKKRIRENSHIILLAENNKGLKNLWTVSSRAYIEGSYYKPRASWEMFKEHSEGLIATSACMLSYMARAILKDDYDECRRLISMYLETFGEENFFLELHTWQLINCHENDMEAAKLNSDMSKINQGLVQLGQEMSVPLIVVNDAHYAWPEQWEEHSLVWSMSTNTDQSENRQAAAHMMGSEEIVYWMSEHGVSRSVTEEAIKNTAWIGERCNVEIERKVHLPRITASPEEELELFLSHVEKGFAKKVVEKGLDIPVYAERTTEEADLIIGKDMHGYFNIVADYCKYAKTADPDGLFGPFKDKEAWLVGPSRGSAGGSLLTFLMDIIELDPIKRDLLFGRFMDPGRKSYPDIDLDFQQSKRPKMKEYLAWKYGEDRVCAIGTLSRLGPRGALADLSRAMGIPIPDAKAMSKIIEQVDDIDTANIEVGWDEVLAEKGGDLAPWVEKYPELFRRIQSLTGLIRQSSTHAAGILISDVSLMGELPLRFKAGKLVTQFEAGDVEDLGFIKFDLLGIRHLDTLVWTRKMTHDGAFDPNFYYDFNDEQYKDPAPWDMVIKGKTTGIFQLETPGMTGVGKRFKPHSDYDVADLISVNRPGITRTGMLEEYLQRRNGDREVSTPHPMMTEILSSTYGVVVFQEQVMLIVRRLAGYSMSEADKVRKIMGKMLYELMKEEKPEFVRRCLQTPEFIEGVKQDLDSMNPNGHGWYDFESRKDFARLCQTTAEMCWQQIEAAGIYSFNQAHAHGYSLIACWGAYMRYYHPAAYLTSCLITDPKRINRYIRELRRLGYRILPPDVNTSLRRFNLAPEGVRYGLTDLKNVGDAALKEIETHRPFTSLKDYLGRVAKRACNARVTETLIRIGAFDSLGDRGETLQEFYDWKGWTDRGIPDFSNEDVIREYEEEVVGNYITSDPMEKYFPMIEGECVQLPDQVWELQQGEIVNIGGMIHKVKTHKTRKNQTMCFLGVTWNEEQFDITIWPQQWDSYKTILREGKPVIVQVERLQRGCSLREAHRLDWLL